MFYSGLCDEKIGVRRNKFTDIVRERFDEFEV